MPFPSSGLLKTSEINTNLGNNLTDQIKFSDFFVSLAAGKFPTQQTIKFSDFYFTQSRSNTALLSATGKIGTTVQEGDACAISADGNTVVVGIPGASNAGTRYGAVVVYRKIDSFWVQESGIITGSGMTGSSSLVFGGFNSVSLSADGNTLAVGATQDNTDVGAVWVFTRSGSTWTQQGSKLIGTGATGSASQGTVALSADGNTLAVGGLTDNSTVGAVWVFTRSGSTWTQQGSKLVGTGGVGTSAQGTSVVLSADGNTLATGAFLDNSRTGAVWVFTRSGDTWTQQGSKLVGTGGVGPEFNQGTAISISSNGNTLAIGGWGDNSDVGAVWVFTRSGATWTQQGSKLVGTGSTGAARQGQSVTLSSDGNVLIIGAPGDNSFSGAFWLFTRTGTTWTQVGSKTTAGTSRQLADSVAISKNGNILIAGIPGYISDGTAFSGGSLIFT